MVKSVVNLSVHRNTLEKRAKRQLGNDFRKTIETTFKEKDIRMFVFVGIDANGKAQVSWDTGGIIPLWAAPSMVMEILQKSMGEVDEDWKPPLRTVERNIGESKE